MLVSLVGKCLSFVGKVLSILQLFRPIRRNFLLEWTEFSIDKILSYDLNLFRSDLFIFN